MDDPELFEMVMALPAEQREAAVREACGDDVERMRHLLELVGLASRGEPSTWLDEDAPEEPEGSTRLEQGARVARYVIVAFLGQGASGEVYEAFDLELTRRVALKLLRRDREVGRDDERRFRREAQALAQIDHPNVVRIFDVGVHEQRRYLTMELIDGTSLRPWIAGAPARGWRAVLDALLPAARGLQAAHEAGIVHRDFKPENVMIDGRGRVVVTDFGIARPFAAEGGAAVPSANELGHRSGEGLATASAIGTPSYMAPEQFSGRVTPWSDQFAFCRVLLEALGEERVSETTDTGPVDAPLALEAALARGPRWLRGLLARGLAAAPEDRHPDMAALIRGLERYRGRRGWVAGTLALGLVVAAFVPVVSRGAAVTCDGWSEDVMVDSLAPTWTSLTEAAQQTASPAAALAQVEAMRSSVDWNLREWSLGRTETCRQHANAMLDDATARVRDRCFGAWESELRRGLQWSAEHPEALVSPRLAQELPREPGRCLWEEAPGSADVEVDPAVRDAIDIALMEAKGLRILGDYAASEARTREALALAEGVGSERDRADVLQRLGALAARNHHWDLAHDLLRRSLAAAEQLGEDGLAADSLIELARTIALQPEKNAGQAAVLLSLARAKLARLGGARVDLTAELTLIEGHVAQMSGEYDVAEASYRTAADLLELSAGPEDFRTASARTNISRVLSDAGRHREAIELGERAIAVRARGIGADHPLLADDRFQLGLIYFRAAVANTGDRSALLAATATHLEQAAIHAGSIHGAGSLERARALVELTNVRRVSGKITPDMAHQVDEFVEVYEDAARRGALPDHVLIHAFRIARDAADDLERWPEALRLAARVVEISERRVDRLDPTVRDDDMMLISYEAYAGDREAARLRLQTSALRYSAAFAQDELYQEQLAALRDQLSTHTTHPGSSR